MPKMGRSKLFWATLKANNTWLNIVQLLFTSKILNKSATWLTVIQFNSFSNCEFCREWWNGRRWNVLITLCWKLCCYNGDGWKKKKGKNSQNLDSTITKKIFIWGKLTPDSFGRTHENRDSARLALLLVLNRIIFPGREKGTIKNQISRLV